jgi:hypothetical protein
MPQLFLADGTGGVNLVTQNEERDFGKLFNREQGIELGFRFRETFKVSAVDEEDDSVDLGEVVAPEPTSWEPRLSRPFTSNCWRCSPCW